MSFACKQINSKLICMHTIPTLKCLPTTRKSWFRTRNLNSKNICFPFVCSRCIRERETERKMPFRKLDGTFQSCKLRRADIYRVDKWRLLEITKEINVTKYCWRKRQWIHHTLPLTFNMPPRDRRYRQQTFDRLNCSKLLMVSKLSHFTY